MNMPLVLAPAASLIFFAASQLTSASPDFERPLSAAVRCMNPSTQVMVFEGTIDVFRAQLKDRPAARQLFTIRLVDLMWRRASG